MTVQAGDAATMKRLGGCERGRENKLWGMCVCVCSVCVFLVYAGDIAMLSCTCEVLLSELDHGEHHPICNQGGQLRMQGVQL